MAYQSSAELCNLNKGVFISSQPYPNTQYRRTNNLVVSLLLELSLLSLSLSLLSLSLLSLSLSLLSLSLLELSLLSLF